MSIGKLRAGVNVVCGSLPPCSLLDRHGWITILKQRIIPAAQVQYRLTESMSGPVKSCGTWLAVCKQRFFEASDSCSRFCFNILSLRDNLSRHGGIVAYQLSILLCRVDSLTLPVTRSTIVPHCLGSKARFSSTMMRLLYSHDCMVILIRYIETDSVRGDAGGWREAFLRSNWQCCHGPGGNHDLPDFGGS